MSSTYLHLNVELSITVLDALSHHLNDRIESSNALGPVQCYCG